MTAETTPEQWDVFISYSSRDIGWARQILCALAESGIRVFLDEHILAGSISSTLLGHLRRSRIMLAIYSREYPTRSACQEELLTAFLAGTIEGDSNRRILLINPVHDGRHIQPMQLRDALHLPAPTTEKSLQKIVRQVDLLLSQLKTTIGDHGSPNQLARHQRPAKPLPHKLTSRWNDVWRLHSALSGNDTLLTQGRSPGVAVVHGGPGVGCSTLVAHYAQLFSPAYPGGIFWWNFYDKEKPASIAELHLPDYALLIIDSIPLEIDSVELQGLISANSTVASVLISGNAKHVEFGVDVEVCELTEEQTRSLFMKNFSDDQSTVTDSEWRYLFRQFGGNPTAVVNTAKHARQFGVAQTIERLHDDDLVLSRWLQPRLSAAVIASGDGGTDILAVLAQLHPQPASLPVLIDALTQFHTLRGNPAPHQIEQVMSELIDRHIIEVNRLTGGYYLRPIIASAIAQYETDRCRTSDIRYCALTAFGKNVALERHSDAVGITARSEIDRYERQNSHHLQIHVRDRITGREFKPGHGILVEALESLYKLSKLSTELQANAPVDAVRSSIGNRPGFGQLAHHLRNAILVPMLDRWHPALTEHIARKPIDVPITEHELNWVHYEELRNVINETGRQAMEVAVELSNITGNYIGLDGSS